MNPTMPWWRLLVASLFITLVSTAPVQAAPKKRINIIFDLGGVIFNTNKVKYTKKIGWHVGLPFCLFKHPRSAFFNHLTSLKPLTDTYVAIDDSGKPVPQLMCDWLKGTTSPQDIHDLIMQSLPGINILNQLFLASMARVTFVPTTFVETQELDTKMLEFVKRCAQQGHDIYVLSNWEPVSCKLLVAQYPELFSLCKGVMFSGEVHLIKPDPAIYHCFLNKYNLKAEDCFFIDNLDVNVTSAQNVGIDGVIFEKNQFRPVGAKDRLNHDQLLWMLSHRWCAA